MTDLADNNPAAEDSRAPLAHTPVNINPSLQLEGFSVDTRRAYLQRFAALLALLLAVLVSALLTLRFQDMGADDPLLVESTLGQLAIWMSAQQALDETTTLETVRTGLTVFSGLIVVVGLAGLAGFVKNAAWSRSAILPMILGLDLLLLVVPVLPEESADTLLLVGILLLLISLLSGPGRASRLLGFVVIVSALLGGWEAAKSAAAATDYQIIAGAEDWNYQAYPSLEATFAALEDGTVAAVIIDRAAVRDILAVHPRADDADAISPAASPYPDLRILEDIETHAATLGRPIIPAFPGRLRIVVRAADVEQWRSANEFVGEPLGALAADFADERFLSVPRDVQLLNLKIFNDFNMPHLQTITEALFQPARRNGEVLLVEILINAGLFTWVEAATGFVSGALLGFLLGAFFAHSRMLERGLLPYVVASQTVPILAIAPMVVIWLGANWVSVAVISAYLTFFPVTINTLRGLQSPDPMAVELMQSYAANRWTILWKLRFPAALPYIFAALKVSATTSVVGAIIGELPSGIRDGLGGAILNFNQFYASDPAKLWAAISISALVGIAFFILVLTAEWVTLRGTLRSA